MTDLNGKCGSCKWFDIGVKTIIGSPCTCSEKTFKKRCSMYKYRTTKACKKWEGLDEAVKSNCRT